MNNSVAPAAAQDQPLPPSMAHKLAGWASVARQYPIFSKTWFGYRMRSFAVAIGLLTALLVFVTVFASQATGESIIRPSVMVWLVVMLALVPGRALAVMVRRQAWSTTREAAGIACALSFGIALALPLTSYTSSASMPAKQGRAPTAQQIEQARTNRLVNMVIWFPVLVWLGGATDLLAYFRQRRMLREAELRDQLARYKDERNEVELQLSVLASQIEPHFLFNTLSGVRAAMLSDPARGVAMIDHLVDYLRATIPQLRSDRAHLLVSLGSQLDAAQAYLGIIEARLPRLVSRISCPPDLRGVAIPPLMLISLVENAVKHGIELKKGPALITICAARQTADGREVLELAVSDNGAGFGSASSGSGIGLSNIRERLKHLYGGEAALSLHAGDEGGVIARIALPLRPLSEGGH
ncbi:MAG: sensor histidine kinase [Massilia sp.]